MIEWVILPIVGIVFVIGAVIYLCRKDKKETEK